MEQPEQCPFLKWAMLESNQRPPPCKGELVISQTFVVVQIFLLTSTFSVLSCRLCSPLFVWVGVRFGVRTDRTLRESASFRLW